MLPMQPLTSAVYSLNSNELNGLSASAFVQLAGTQTFTGANTFQPNSNVTGVTILQNSVVSPTADIFDVDTQNSTPVIQVTGPSANNAAISLTSLGTSNSISLNSAASLSFTGNAASTWDIGNYTLSLQTTNGGPITTGSGLFTMGGNLTLSGANPVIKAGTLNNSLSLNSNGTGALYLGNNAASNTIQIGNSTGTASAETIQIGSVNTTAGSSSAVTIGSTIAGSTTLQGGSTSEAVTSSGVSIKTSTNSSTALQILNAAGEAILQVNTVGSNLLTYGGFESGNFNNINSGWGSISPAQIFQNSNTTYAYNGLNSLKLNTTSANGGTQTDVFNQTVVGGTYVVSFYVYPTGASMNANAFTVILNDGTNHTCIPANENLSTNGFRRIYCSATTSNNLVFLSISQSDSVARTIYIDSVQLQAGYTPTIYQIGSEELRGPITIQLLLNLTPIPKPLSKF